MRFQEIKKRIASTDNSPIPASGSLYNAFTYNYNSSKMKFGAICKLYSIYLKQRQDILHVFDNYVSPFQL